LKPIPATREAIGQEMLGQARRLSALALEMRGPKARVFHPLVEGALLAVQTAAANWYDVGTDVLCGKARADAPAEPPPVDQYPLLERPAATMDPPRERNPGFFDYGGPSAGDFDPVASETNLASPLPTGIPAVPGTPITSEDRERVNPSRKPRRKRASKAKADAAAAGIDPTNPIGDPDAGFDAGPDGQETQGEPEGTPPAEPVADEPSDDWQSVRLADLLSVDKGSLARVLDEDLEIETLGDLHQVLSNGDSLETLQLISDEAACVRETLARFRVERGWGPEEGIPEAWLEREPEAEKEAEASPADRDNMDGGLHRALHSFQGAADRWWKLKQAGATDAQLREAIGKEFGIAGGGSEPGKRPHWYAGGKNPRFWWNNIGGTGKPTLAGAALVKRVRAILEIPQPAEEVVRS
jgi:hypothetical protein